MITFHKIRFRNFLATGNTFVEIQLDKADRTIISGKNGHGKCLRGPTQVEIGFQNPEVREAFLKFISSRDHFST